MWTIQRSRGFTLIEVMVTVAIVAILASVALPSYSAYVQRSRTAAAFDGLSSLATRLEQRYQDTGCYGTACPSTTTTCGPSLPADTETFAYSCTVSGSGQGFTAKATGRGAMVNYEYTVNNTGNRATTEHPKGQNLTCWTSKGGTACDG